MSVLAPDDDLLVRAALCADPEAGADAYERWRARVDVERLGGAQLRFLPFLADRLSAVSDEDPVADRLRRVARFTWLRSQVLLSRTLPSVDALDAAGIQVTAIKGVAVIHHTGISPALRPMDDLDVLVPLERAPEAAALLEARGLTPPRSSPRDLDDPILSLHHSLNYDDDTGAAIDLHWHALRSSRHRDADRGFQARAEPATLRNTRFRVLAPEDTLVNVVEHGHQWASAPALRWASDATLLVRHCELDWDLVARTAREHRQSATLAGALSYLADALGAPVPAEARRELERVRPTADQWHRRTRREVDPNDGGPGLPGRLGRAIEAWDDYAAEAIPPGGRAGPRELLGWARRMWLLDRSAGVPVHAAFVALGRPWGLRRRLGGHRRVARRHADVPPYEPGTSLSFGGDGSGDPYAVAGWDVPEGHSRWTRGGLGRIVLPLRSAPAGEWELEAECAALVTGYRPRADVDVVVDGRRAASWPIESIFSEARTARFPAPGPGPLEILFVVRHPATPVDARWPVADPRQIGLQLFALRVGPVGDPAESGR